jgi:hypothetical protein
MPAHLWEALEQMSSEMGVDANGLVAQAVFTLARLNGYLVPGRAGEPVAPPDRPAAGRAGARAATSSPSAIGRRPAEPEPEPEPLDAGEEGNPFDPQGEDYLPNEGAEDYPPEPEPEPEPAPPPRPGKGALTLTLLVAGRDPFKMTTDSFTIGRGKTCDFVIESNRVSREHCRILREGNEFSMEDLNSSNGTFMQPGGEKVASGRKIKLKDGDEFKLGTEKIKFQIRK